MFYGRVGLQCPVVSVLAKRLFSKDCAHIPSCPSSTGLSVTTNTAKFQSKKLAGISTTQRCFSCTSRNMANNKHSNRLALEKSPYLLQHAHNPVDWYPWGEEAFEKARKEDKLIFLSVGYSTCHWCHVMERESFENEEIAKIMNENFVNVKVDREERPDVDRVYMTFVQASAGRGGWPMSVFLTPTLMPIAGGTYFPPRDMFGRPGFPTLLNSIANQATTGQGGWPMSAWLTHDLTPIHGGTYYPPDDRYFGQPGFKSLLFIIATQWKENKQKFFESGGKILEILQKNSKLESASNSGNVAVPNKDCWKTCFSMLARNYEAEYGGFGNAPKFPQPSNFNFMFHVYARNPNSEEGKRALEMCTHTLQMMAKGGIHDHVSQGFARYSTDDKWHIPHFEKMLYDQGQLLVSYAAAYVATKNEMFAEVLRDIITYVNRDLSHPLGGFYSAEDADSLPGFDSDKKREGAFCAWTFEEVDALLGDKPVAEGSHVTLQELACHHFDIKPEGNVNPYQDPHDELKNQNILIITGSEEATAEKFKLSVEQVRAGLKNVKEILHEARQNRPRPHLDDKMITAWNGLMLSGLSKASEALGDKSIVERAVKAATFIKEHLYVEESGTLLRSCYQGPNGTVTQISAPIAGFADDYAFLVRGLMDLYEASGNYHWLEWAEQLQDKQDALFWDSEAAGYFSAAQDPAIVLRLKEDQDGAEPACGSVSASNLLRLAALLERPELEDRASRLLAAYSSRLSSIPVALPEMSSALMLFHDSPTQILMAGDPNSESTHAMLDVVRSRLIPGRVFGMADGCEDNILYRRNETIRGMKPSKDGKTLAYVCQHHTCSLPISTPEQLRALLDETIEH